MWETLSKNSRGMPFIVTENKELKEKYGVSEKVEYTLVRFFKNDFQHFPEDIVTFRSKAEFIKDRRFPDVQTYSMEAFQRIFTDA